MATGHDTLPGTQGFQQLLACYGDGADTGLKIRHTLNRRWSLQQSVAVSAFDQSNLPTLTGQAKSESCAGHATADHENIEHSGITHVLRSRADRELAFH